MSFKDKLQERIAKGTYESIMDGERVIFKKSRMPLIGDWTRIYPPIDENGKMLWINLLFGGKKNLLRLIIYMLLIAGAFLAFYEVFSSYGAVMNSPCVQTCLKSVVTNSPLIT